MLIYSKEQCLEMINLYIEAEKTVLSGKSYKIGTRELQRENLSEIISARRKWEENLKLAQNNGKVRKIRRFIPRDL